MTLDRLLSLARAARRSPHLRRALHDALLERYGEAYEQYVQRAHQLAQGVGGNVHRASLGYPSGAPEPFAVMLNADQLAEAERRYGRPPPGYVLNSYGAFMVYPLRTLARSSNRIRSEQVVHVARPSAGASRSRDRRRRPARRRRTR